MPNRIPFVYVVRNRTTGLFYYGSRYGKGCHPRDLWTTYFTSSNMVAKLINEYGKEDFDVSVIQEFPGDIESARRLELLLLQSFKTAPQCINICRSTGLVDIIQASRAGKVGGAVVKSRKVGILAPVSAEHRSWRSSLGGKAGGRSQIASKTGIHAQTREERLRFSSIAGKTALERGHNVAFNNNTFAAMGRVGGKRNAGSRFYNDGVNEYRVRAEEFDELMANNPNFRPGRIPAFQVTCPYCNKSGAVAPMRQHHFEFCPTNPERKYRENHKN